MRSTGGNASVFNLFRNQLLEWTQAGWVPGFVECHRRVTAHPNERHGSPRQQSPDGNVDNPEEAIISQIDPIECLLDAQLPSLRTRSVQLDYKRAGNWFPKPSLGIVSRRVQYPQEQITKIVLGHGARPVFAPAMIMGGVIAPYTVDNCDSAKKTDGPAPCCPGSLNKKPRSTTDCGNVVSVSVLPMLIDALLNACAPARVRAKYFPDWTPFEP
jgi:hypothetical protein